MLASISSRELARWMAYYEYCRVERIGPEAAQDRRTAMVVHTIYTMLKGEKDKPRKLEDFLPPVVEPEAQAPGDLRQRMIALANRRRGSGTKKAGPSGNAE